MIVLVLILTFFIFIGLLNIDNYQYVIRNKTRRRYRIYPSYSKFEVQIWRFFWPFWMEVNDFYKESDAKNYIDKKIRNVFKEI